MLVQKEKALDMYVIYNEYVNDSLKRMFLRGMLCPFRIPPEFTGRKNVLVQRPPIAQLVEQLPFKETVPGSSPGGRTLNKNSFKSVHEKKGGAWLPKK